MSQNVDPDPSSPYALAVRYHALIVAMIARIIITVNFFIDSGIKY